MLHIPALGAKSEIAVYEGRTEESLDLGSWHYPGTASAGEPGNFVALGHRTTRPAPFHDLHLLKRGDRIEAADSAGTYTYKVVEIRVTSSSDRRIVDPGSFGTLRGSSGRYLTLVTCHPLGSSAKRLVVVAEQAVPVSGKR
ncbi:hypothetical protein GCM10010468_45720 [Actinocorallia longicatena]|uniref:Uncharacterized protein n=2 Tax=Actinocorallia longicatena TaxID=111803 RepID=A0ABP6QDX8_9ACTN